LLLRRIPHHLEELRLENLKILPNISDKLITMLNERCSISKLGLVDVNLNENSFATLCEYIDYSSYLTELDIR